VVSGGGRWQAAVGGACVGCRAEYAEGGTFSDGGSGPFGDKVGNHGYEAGIIIDRPGPHKGHAGFLGSLSRLYVQIPGDLEVLDREPDGRYHYRVDSFGG
jgi:hypothetical protein